MVGQLIGSLVHKLSSFRLSGRIRILGFHIVLSLLAISCGGLPAESSQDSPQVTAIPTDSVTPTDSNEISPSPTPIQTQDAPQNPTAIQPEYFDGESAYDYLLEQMDFGPRFPGSPGHEMVGDYIVEKMQDIGWEVEEQRFPYRGIEGRNIIARENEGIGPVIILGAHYDSRKLADKTPGSEEPVPGAVDGASGVAVLLELAQTIDLDRVKNEIWLAFFDVEDQGSGGMPGFDWIVGSTVMADDLNIRPEAMVLVDMIGDADQQLYYERNSDPALRQRIWEKAAELGYQEFFIQEPKYSILDDHLPFARLGIPAVDIIDFDYPYWHTVEDTADKASPESLHRVGRTLEEWLENLGET